MTDKTELREKLAAIEHERWADWQRWCHKVLRENNPSPEQGDILERWDRQIKTPYSELSEREKQSDREQVDRYWHLIEQYAQERETAARNEGHWYAGTYGRDANGFEVGHTCSCGLKSVNRKAIDSHVAWKLAELTSNTKEEKEYE